MKRKPPFSEMPCPTFKCEILKDKSAYDLKQLEIISTSLRNALVAKMKLLDGLTISKQFYGNTLVSKAKVTHIVRQMDLFYLIKTLLGNHIVTKHDMRAKAFLRAVHCNKVNGAVSEQEIWWLLADDIDKDMKVWNLRHVIPTLHDFCNASLTSSVNDIEHENNVVLNLLRGGKDKEALILTKRILPTSKAVKTISVLANKLKSAYYYDFVDFGDTAQVKEKTEQTPNESETKMNQQEPVVTPIKDENGKHKGTMKQYTAVLQSPMDLVTLVNALDSLGIKTTSIVVDLPIELITEQKGSEENLIKIDSLSNFPTLDISIRSPSTLTEKVAASWLNHCHLLNADSKMASSLDEYRRKTGLSTCEEMKERLRSIGIPEKDLKGIPDVGYMWPKSIEDDGEVTITPPFEMSINWDDGIKEMESTMNKK